MFRGSLPDTSLTSFGFDFRAQRPLLSCWNSCFFARKTHSHGLARLLATSPPIARLLATSPPLHLSNLVIKTHLSSSLQRQCTKELPDSLPPPPLATNCSSFCMHSVGPRQSHQYQLAVSDLPACCPLSTKQSTRRVSRYKTPLALGNAQLSLLKSLQKLFFDSHVQQVGLRPLAHLDLKLAKRRSRHYSPHSD